jgi:molybdopterin-guanine dinucleotide biosynthesis protein A
MSCPTAHPATLALNDTTGVVLAGGQGRRMGGRDKGLQLLAGQPLALRTLERLRPQVGRLAISANRHREQYRQWCAEVWSDLDFEPAAPRYQGPLAGVLAALQHAETPLVQLAACDCPDFPLDLARRLRQRLERGTADGGLDLVLPLSVEADGQRQLQPTFALLRRTLLPSLRDFMAGDERRLMRWMGQQRHALLEFVEPAAFRNYNHLADLTEAAKPPMPGR